MTHDNPGIAVLGSGRMGQELIRLVAREKQMHLAGVWVRHEQRLSGAVEGAAEALAMATVSSDLQAVLRRADVAIDFTLPAATTQILDAAVATGKPLVCGVSGLDDAILNRMRTAAASIPVFYDRNMSFGIAVMADLVRRAGAALGREFAASVHETHHVHKVDAPSGTALKLGEALAEARNQDFTSVYRYADKGAARRESPEDIVFSATRQGEVAGEHTVTFRSDTETLELTHKVTDRRVFAAGALAAARWLIGRQPGLYRMSDFANGG